MPIGHLSNSQLNKLFLDNHSSYICLGCSGRKKLTMNRISIEMANSFDIRQLEQYDLDLVLVNKLGVQLFRKITVKTPYFILQQLIVSDDDIRRQESRVLEARKKLQEIMK